MRKIKRVLAGISVLAMLFNFAACSSAVEGTDKIDTGSGVTYDDEYMKYLDEYLGATTSNFSHAQSNSTDFVSGLAVGGYGVRSDARSYGSNNTRSTTSYGRNIVYTQKRSSEDDRLPQNKFIKTSDESTSTFSIDVDNASYTELRSYINSDNIPQIFNLRTEECINYFDYDYKDPEENELMSVNAQLADCPWNSNNQLLLLGLQAVKVDIENRDPLNLVILLDTSGSMTECIDAIKNAMGHLSNNLTDKDRISLVTYAGSSEVLLSGVSGADKDKIMDAINELSASGATNGGAGLEQAYDIAKENFVDGGSNRVLLVTDGDFNLGLQSAKEMKKFVEKKRDLGIDISVLGCDLDGCLTGDPLMEAIADWGNGNFYFLDKEKEAIRILETEFAGTMFKVASDVKLQLEFNKDTVAEYRLVGYENRVLDNEDFENDAVDAGDMGSGHTVTALYELVLNDNALDNSDNQIAKFNIRYKNIGESESKLQENEIKSDVYQSEASGNVALASAVTEFCMLIEDKVLDTDCEYVGTSSVEDIKKLVSASGKQDDKTVEFLELIKYIT